VTTSARTYTTPWDTIEGRIAQYLRADLSDLLELVDQDGLFHGLLIDLEAVAKLVHSRANLPLETHVVTARLADGGAE